MELAWLNVTSAATFAQIWRVATTIVISKKHRNITRTSEFTSDCDELIGLNLGQLVSISCKRLDRIKRGKNWSLEPQERAAPKSITILGEVDIGQEVENNHELGFAERKYLLFQGMADTNAQELRREDGFRYQVNWMLLSYLLANQKEILLNSPC